MPAGSPTACICMGVAETEQKSKGGGRTIGAYDRAEAYDNAGHKNKDPFARILAL